MCRGCFSQLLLRNEFPFRWDRGPAWQDDRQARPTRVHDLFGRSGVGLSSVRAAPAFAAAQDAEAVSLDDAVRAVTIHAARQLEQGDRLGSLENRKEADFTILEGDPYKVSPDAIADIKVSETWVAGERKFSA
jgi:cytosine/adenosine deaminase-related metal-dependent hydrolase